MERLQSSLRFVLASGFCSFLLLAVGTGATAGGFTEMPPARDLTLKELLQLVLENNESLQAKVLDVEIGRRRAKATYGVFEPELFGGVSREVNNRENTAEQERTQLANQFHETNNIYQGGIESLVPTGARVRLGYTLRDLNNSLQGSSFLGSPRGGTNGEWQTFFGVSVTQPLLKNAGQAATLAEIRVAALSSDVAFQEYRRQLMIVLSTAEASYWNLYLAQEQARSFRESVALAESVLADVREKVQAGKGAELEVMEAQAGLAARKNRLHEAIQKVYEAADQVSVLYGAGMILTNRLVRAVDQPELKAADFNFFTTWRSAFDLNPDYLAQRKRCAIEGVRLAYAHNQLLPALDLKGSYGLNGLGTTPGESWEDVQSQDFPSWSIGVELRVPLGGGIKSRNERAAAQLSQKRALIDLKSLENQIANAAHTAIQKIRSKQDSVPGAEAVVTYVSALLQTERSRLEVGKVEAQKVLETDAALLEAKSTLTETLVQYRRACLERELIAGALLRDRGFDLSQADLQVRTARLVRGNAVTTEEYQRTLQELGGLHMSVPATTNLFVEPQPPAANPREDELRRLLREKLDQSKPEKP